MKKLTSKTSVIDALYLAVAAYVAEKGGTVLVAGGIQVQQWPGDLPHQFTVAVKCTGNPPTYTEEQEAK